jgi:hypothetical protein
VKQGHDDALLFGEAVDDGEDYKGTFPDVQGKENALQFHGCSSAQTSHRGSTLTRCYCVERQVEAQHVHPGIAQDAEVGGVGVLLYEFAHLFDAQAAGLGDAVGLEAGILRADMQVEAAAEAGFP